MIADLSIGHTVRPTPSPKLVDSVTSKDIMQAAHRYRREHRSTMGEAMQWAHHCRREWQEAVQSREEAKRQRYFEAQRIRRHTGKIYDVVERIGHRSGIERVSLTRREKIEANNLALSKGLQPKYVTL